MRLSWETGSDKSVEVVASVSYETEIKLGCVGCSNVKSVSHPGCGIETAMMDFPHSVEVVTQFNFARRNNPTDPQAIITSSRVVSRDDECDPSNSCEYVDQIDVWHGCLSSDPAILDLGLQSDPPIYLFEI